MKKLVLISIVFAFNMCLTNAQTEIVVQGEGGANTEMNTDTTKTDEVFVVVEQMPEFPGGQDAMNTFLDKNLKYPQTAKDKGIQGKVWLGFTVQKDGKVTDVEVLRGIGGGCDEEAVRVLKLMPDWKPGYQSGKPVIVKFRFPINFTLR